MGGRVGGKGGRVMKGFNVLPQWLDIFKARNFPQISLMNLYVKSLCEILWKQ